MIYTDNMAYAPLNYLLSAEEYLEFERDAAMRHEYVAGALYALAGGTRWHNLIISNLVFHLMSASRGTPCRVYAENFKVRPTADLFYYPDVMVTCHEEEGDPLYETAPCLLIEVLSKSTAHIDKREKFSAYKQIETLKVYVIVHQDKKLVERYWVDDEGRWQHAQVSGGQVPLECPTLTLSTEEIYENISF